MKRATGRWFDAAALVALMMSAVVGAVTSSGHAEVVDIRAYLETTVTEMVMGEPASTDTSVESFPETSLTLPIEVFAGLGDFTGELDVPHGGRGLASFEDPTLSVTPNPAEFGVEADCYSLEEGVAYEVVSEAAEVRDVFFGVGELGGADDSEQQWVGSTVFVSGAVVVWSDDPERDLSGLIAEFDFTVVQETGTNGEEMVFEASLAVEGLPQGEVSLDYTSVLSAVLGRPELLLSVGGPATSGIVGQLEDIGSVHLVIVPAQEIDYAYLVTPGEEFKLRANVRCRSVNLPEGTGVAVVFGRPFSELAGVIDPVMAKPSGAAVQAAVNRAILETGPSTERGLMRSPLCGAFGLLGVGTLCGRHRRSRHDR